MKQQSVENHQKKKATEGTTHKIKKFLQRVDVPMVEIAKRPDLLFDPK